LFVDFYLIFGVLLAERLLEKERKREREREREREMG
jgi:hypothetical protein